MGGSMWSPELTVECVWLALWPAANPGAAFGLAAVSRLWVAINGLQFLYHDGLQSSKKKCKMMLRSGYFLGHLWKWYAPERKFRAENGGLSRSTYPICIYMEVPPPLHPGKSILNYYYVSLNGSLILTWHCHAWPTLGPVSKQRIIKHCIRYTFLNTAHRCVLGYKCILFGCNTDINGQCDASITYHPLKLSITTYSRPTANIFYLFL